MGVVCLLPASVAERPLLALRYGEMEAVATLRGQACNAEAAERGCRGGEFDLGAPFRTNQSMQNIWVWLKKPVPKWNLVSGNMDQNLRNPSSLILSHCHMSMRPNADPFLLL